MRSKHELFSYFSKFYVSAIHTAPPFLVCVLFLFFFALTNFYNITVPIKRKKKSRLSSKSSEKEKLVGLNYKVLSNKFQFYPKNSERKRLIFKNIFSFRNSFMFYIYFFQTGQPSISNNPLLFFVSF